jgi:hypothetical protein
MSGNIAYMNETGNLASTEGTVVHAMVAGDPMYRGSTHSTVCRPSGNNAYTGSYTNRSSVFYIVWRPVTCKRCLAVKS